MDNQTPLYARLLLNIVRPFPNFDVFFIKPLRRKAIDMLELKQGDRVLDLGCGIGGSFPYLVNAVGKTGEIIGVEISDSVLRNTRKRVEKNNWNNITLINSAAQDVKISNKANGVLMFAAPDVYASNEALKNIFPNVMKGSKVVVFGAKTNNKLFFKGFNKLIKQTVSKLSFNTTPLPDDKPWLLLEHYITGIKVKQLFFGLFFLLSGETK